MKKILLIIFLLLITLSLIEVAQEFKQTEQKKQLVKKFCDDLKIGTKFNFSERVNNINIFGNDTSFLYNENTIFDSFVCSVELNNGIIIKTSFN